MAKHTQSPAATPRTATGPERCPQTYRLSMLVSLPRPSGQARRQPRRLPARPGRLRPPAGSDPRQPRREKPPRTPAAPPTQGPSRARGLHRVSPRRSAAPPHLVRYLLRLVGGGPRRRGAPAQHGGSRSVPLRCAPLPAASVLRLRRGRAYRRGGSGAGRGRCWAPGLGAGRRLQPGGWAFPSSEAAGGSARPLWRRRRGQEAAIAPGTRLGRSGLGRKVPVPWSARKRWKKK